MDNGKDRVLPATGERELFFFYFCLFFAFHKHILSNILLEVSYREER